MPVWLFHLLQAGVEEAALDGNTMLAALQRFQCCRCRGFKFGACKTNVLREAGSPTGSGTQAAIPHRILIQLFGKASREKQGSSLSHSCPAQGCSPATKSYLQQIHPFSAVPNPATGCPCVLACLIKSKLGVPLCRDHNPSQRCILLPMHRNAPLTVVSRK